jgi:hypothetical protein
MKDDQRTITQNKALHLLFEMTAEALNDSGQDMRKVLKETVDISWTKESVKSYLFHSIMKAMYQKESTADLTRGELQKVYEVFHRHLSEKAEIDLPFPSNFEQYLQQLG